ncbi:MAG: hypothetical protein EXQ50_07505 [Acidobacteria bacterium]|nr:hypothetical protein [Acidobacteriota bacterium]MSO61919.1 hypothetical protein [Acidobacteriota bacterium]
MKPSVFWPTTLQAATLFVATGLAIWAVVVARTRRGVPGSSSFTWLMMAVAIWSFTSALHTLVGDTATRIVIAKVQYLAVAPIGVLWLLFTSHYSRATWPSDHRLRAAIWIVPAITLALAATNEQHEAYWRACSIRSSPPRTRAEGQGTRFRVWFPLILSIHSTRPANDLTRGQSTPS